MPDASGNAAGELKEIIEDLGIGPEEIFETETLWDWCNRNGGACPQTLEEQYKFKGPNGDGS